MLQLAMGDSSIVPHPRSGPQDSQVSLARAHYSPTPKERRFSYWILVVGSAWTKVDRCPCALLGFPVILVLVPALALPSGCKPRDAQRKQATDQVEY